MTTNSTAIFYGACVVAGIDGILAFFNLTIFVACIIASKNENLSGLSVHFIYTTLNSFLLNSTLIVIALLPYLHVDEIFSETVCRIGK